MRKLYLFIQLFALASTASIAQNELTGKITDSKDSSALAGVTVFIPELKTAGVTDANGLYRIKNLPAGEQLVEIRLLGYASITREVEIKSSTNLNAELTASNIDIPEVVVTGVSSATEQKTSPI